MRTTNCTLWHWRRITEKSGKWGNYPVFNHQVSWLSCNNEEKSLFIYNVFCMNIIFIRPLINLHLQCVANPKREGLLRNTGIIHFEWVGPVKAGWALVVDKWRDFALPPQFCFMLFWDSFFLTTKTTLMWNFIMYTVFLEMIKMSCSNKVFFKKTQATFFCNTHIFNLFLKNIPKYTCEMNEYGCKGICELYFYLVF